MKKTLSLLFLLLFASSTLFSQITIKELPADNSYQTDSVNYASTLTRKFVPLNSDWKVYVEDSKATSVNVNVPSKFNSNKPIIHQKSLSIDPKLLENHFFRIHFLGISYLVDIYLNDLILVKKTGGNIPFSIVLPNELINIEGENVLTLKIIDELDSKSTIPLHQRFLFPKESGGILREVFLEMGGFDPTLRALQDWDLWLRIASKYDLAYLADPLVYYRVHALSTSRSPRKTEPYHLELIKRTFAPDGVGASMPHLRKRALASSYGALTVIGEESRDYRFALRCAIRSTWHYPWEIYRWKSILRIALLATMSLLRNDQG